MNTTKLTFAALAVAAMTMPAARADILPDTTRLADLKPGTIMRVLTPLRVCANDNVFNYAFFFSDSVVSGSRKNAGSSSLCTTYPQGTALEVRGSAFTVVPGVDISPSASDAKAVTLTFDDLYLGSISTLANSFSGVTKENLTIHDLRRTLKWGVRFEASGASLPTVSENTEPKSVPAAVALRTGPQPASSSQTSAK